MAENDSKSWWQTMPGILTGLAAIITAVTGLMLALNRTSGRSDAVTPSSTSSPPPVTRDARPASPSTPASASTGEIPLPEIHSVKLAGGSLVITILSARSEPIDLERRALKFGVRFRNEGKYPAVFGSSSYRLIVGEETREPTNLVSEAIGVDSSRDAEMRFELPVSVKDVVLQISAGDEKSRIPIKLP